jgi:hypothetical protein
MLLHMDVDFRSDLDIDEVIGDFGDFADDAASDGNFIAFLQGGNHGAMLFGLFHLRTNQHEPEQYKNHDKRKEAGPIWGGSGGWSGESGTDQHDKPFSKILDGKWLTTK